MELVLLEGSKNENGNKEIESCEHFSIRAYVAKASERDPKSGKPIPDSMSILPLKKFRRWDCDNCMNKLISSSMQNLANLVLSSDQSSNNTNNSNNNNDDNKNNDTSCSISFLGTTLVPLSINSSGGSVPVPVPETEQDSNPDIIPEDKPLTELTKSDARQLAQPDACQLAQSDACQLAQGVESEKSKEIEEIMANTSKSSDLNLNTNFPVLNKKLNAKFIRPKSRKVRSLAEIIGSDESILPQKPCRPDYEDPTAEKNENNLGTIIGCNNSDAIKEKLISNKSNNNKKKFKTLDVVDETASLMSWLKKGNKKIKKKSKGKFAKRKIFGGESSNVLEQGIIVEKEENKKVKDISLVGNNIVKKKRTKKPRKCLQLQGGAIVGEIVCNMSCSAKISKKLQHGGIKKSATSGIKLSQEKGEKKNLKRSGAEVKKVRKKKKQKISEQNSNDLPMDIVELLAKSLQDKHSTNKTNSNSNLNLSVVSQNKPGNEKLLNSFPCNKSSFNNYNLSVAGALKTVQNDQIGNNNEHNFDLNRVIIEQNRVLPVLNPPLGYPKQYTNYTYNYPPNIIPVVPVREIEYSRNEAIPATHLLQLMDASSYLPPPHQNPNYLSPNHQNPNYFHHHGLMPNYNNLHQNPCMPFRPLPRVGVLGDLLQMEITSPKYNCGTQSGYRIGDLNENNAFNSVNYVNNSNNNNDVNKGEEGICIINKNPADFTEIDENNEYMIEGSELNPNPSFEEITPIYVGPWRLIK